MKNYFLIQLSITLLLLACAVNGTFIIVPTTQYVWVNTTATFECATDTDYELVFSIPDVLVDTSADPLQGGGRRLTATFTATLATNGTSVTCAVTEDFTVINTTDVVYVFVQGPPSLHNLIAVQDECSIFIVWSPPYLLRRLSVSYKVYIDDELIQDDITDTNITYYPNVTSSTIYDVSVIAYNESVGDGPPVDIMVEYNIESIGTIKTNLSVTRRLSLTNWLNWFTIPSTGICRSFTYMVRSCSKTNPGQCYTASTTHGNVTVSTQDDNMVVEANMTLPEDDLFDTCVMIDTPERMIATNNVSTSTHDLQDVTVVKNTSDTLCLQFTLVDGTMTYDVSVVLYCSSLEELVSQFFYSNNLLIFSGCITDLYPNTWTLRACDGFNNCENSAFTSHIVLPNNATTGTSATVSNVLASFTYTASYSATIVQGTPTVLPRAPGPPVGAIIGGVVGGVVMAVIIVIVIVACVMYCYYKYKKHSKTSPHYATCAPFIEFDGRPRVVSVTTASSSPVPMVKSSPTTDAPTITTTTSLPEEHTIETLLYDYATTPQKDTESHQTQQYEDVQLKQQSNPHPSQNTVVYADAKDLTFTSPAVSQIIDEANKTIYVDTRPMFPKSLRNRSEDSLPTQQELVEILVPRLSSKWQTLGIALGIAADVLEEIRENRFDRADDCLKDVLVMWEDTATDDRPFTWSTVLEVLRSRKINENSMADFLAKNLSM